MTNDEFDCYGLNKARTIAWLAITLSTYVLVGPTAWAIIGFPLVLWLRFDKNSRAATLVEQIFDFSKKGAN